ncbi:MAG: multiprotein-bridging factor 1 family protein [Oscillospiraceae bacterium]
MRTWEDYKNHVKAASEQDKIMIEEIENLAEIISAVIEKRTSLGLSQRDLAAMCNIPQSSIARLESMKTPPNISTLLKIMQPLGLKLTVSDTQ